MSAPPIHIISNSLQGTEVLIKDMGIVIPPSGGSEVLELDDEVEQALESNDLRDLCLDDAHNPSGSTLQLSPDGISIVPATEADIEAFLDSRRIEGGAILKLEDLATDFADGKRFEADSGGIVEADPGSAGPGDYLPLTISLIKDIGEPYIKVGNSSWTRIGTFIFPGTDKCGTDLKMVANHWSESGKNSRIRVRDETNNTTIFQVTGISSSNDENIVEDDTPQNLPTGQVLFEVQTRKGTGDAYTAHVQVRKV